MKMRSRFFVTFLLSLTGLFVIGCSNGESSKAVESALEEVATTEPTATKPETDKINLDFKPGFQPSDKVYKPLEFAANAPAYTVNQNLSNVDNIGQFANLTQKQKDMIAQNGFVVMPANAEQLFYIYEDNAYKQIPSFVTADSVLQLYHIFYDYSLRNLETDFFYEDLIRLNENMITQLMTEYDRAQKEELKEGISKMIGYFGVAASSMGRSLPADFPAELVDLVKEECALIANAQGTAESPLFGYIIDYSLFQVRGHYTRSEELGRYFRAMNWYGVVPIPFYDQEGNRDELSAVRAITATIALCRLPQEDGIRLWENIYSTTSFYVGEADDITPYEVAAALSPRS